MSFDDFGIWGIYPQKGDPIYDIVAISKYCQQYHISSKDLTDEEIKKFIIGYEE